MSSTSSRSVRGYRQGSSMTWEVYVADHNESLEELIQCFRKVSDFYDSGVLTECLLFEHSIMFTYVRLKFSRPFLLDAERLIQSIQLSPLSRVTRVAQVKPYVALHELALQCSGEHAGFGKVYELFKQHISNKNSASDTFFITVPRYDADLNRLSEAISKYLREAYTCEAIGQIWVREYHEDNYPHIHGLIKLNAKLFLCYQEIFDEVFCKVVVSSGSDRIYGNIQPAISEKAVKKYILKTVPKDLRSNSPNVIVLGCYCDNKGTSATLLDEIIRKILDGFSVIEMLEESACQSRCLILKNMRALRDLEAIRSRKRKLCPFKAPDEVCGAEANTIRNWLIDLNNKELRKPNVKQRHLFITGEPETGKSSFLQLIQAYFNVYTLDNSAWFSPSYADGKVDVALYDEFMPQTKKPLSILNLFLRGTSHDIFECKGGQIIKTDNRLPAIFISNYTKKQIMNYYNNDTVAEAFAARFKWVELGSKKIPRQLSGPYVLNHSSVGVQCEAIPIFSMPDYDKCLTARLTNGCYFTIQAEPESTELKCPMYFTGREPTQLISPVFYGEDIQMTQQIIKRYPAELVYEDRSCVGTIKIKYNTDFTVHATIGKRITLFLAVVRVVPHTPLNALTQSEFDSNVITGSTHLVNYDDDCSVCMGSVIGSMISIPCKHNFHPYCIRKYFTMYSGECPLCKRNYQDN